MLIGRNSFSLGIFWPSLGLVGRTTLITPLTTDYQACNLDVDYMTNSSTVFIYCTQYTMPYHDLGTPSQLADFLISPNTPPGA